MAHHIEKNYAFFVGESAWHGKGQTLDHAPSIEEAAKMAYPWALGKFPLHVSATDPATGKVEYAPVEDHALVIRSDGKQLGPVGNGYVLVQPSEAMASFEPWIDSGLVTLESGASLYDGKGMMLCAKIAGADADIVPGDPVGRYVTFYTGFCGNLELGYMQTMVRTVCHNTLIAGMEEAKEKGRKRSTKHTKNVRSRMVDMREAITQALESFHSDIALCKELANRKVTRKVQEHYIRRVIIGSEIEKPLAEQKISARAENNACEVIGLLDTQKGIELVPAIRGTAWQAYNAVTQYLTHDYGRSEETRRDSNLFGAAKNLNKQAFELALRLN